jgi:hypothetical protein
MGYKILLLVLLSTLLNAQSYLSKYTFKGTALDVITEPANVAMGESFVANPFGKLSFFENPATLSKEHPTSLFYYSRSHDWIDYAKGFRYAAMGLTTSSQFGHIGFTYNQFSTGKTEVTGEPSEKYVEEMNNLFLLSISKTLFHNLTIGASIKVFNHSRKSNAGQEYELSSNNPLLLDFGFQYSFNPIEINQRIQLYSFLGGSIQNIGQDYKEVDHLYSKVEHFIRLPRYFRFGFTGNIQFKNQNGTPDIIGTITGEYKTLINPLSYEQSDIDYYGAGCELTIKEYVTIRVGAFQTPEYTALYERAKLLFRYGAGFNLPLQKLGVNIPAIISFDYTFIPINQFQYGVDGATGESNSKLLHAVGLSLYYSDFLN